MLREFKFAQGQSSGAGAERTVLIFGNKTSAGSETVDKIGAPIASLDDAVARFGRRSEWMLMYQAMLAADPSAATATVYGIAPTESAGTAATKTITFASGAASDTTTCTIELIGQSTSFSVTSGDTAITQAAACAAAINAAASGGWPVTAAQGAPANDHIVTVTVANLGPRGDHVLAGLRATYAKSVTTTASVSAVSSGTTEDDFTTAFAEMAKGEYTYQVSPKYSTSGPTSTDNGVGEHIANLVAQSLPVNGKSQMAIFGLVGSQANATTVGTDSDANSVFAKFVHQKVSDWTPGMLAAHYCGVMRSQWAAYPAANLAGFTNSDSTPWKVPAAYLKSNWLTAVEIESDLKDGVIPIGTRANGSTYVVRDITSRNLNSSGDKDYRASEGHITSVAFSFWGRVKQILTERKQPNVAENPAAGQKPLPGFMYPSTVENVIKEVIDDFSGPAPLGIYPSALLDPSLIDQMKASVRATKIPGGISCVCDFAPVQHFLFSETTMNQIGGAY